MKIRMMKITIQSASSIAFPFMHCFDNHLPSMFSINNAHGHTHHDPFLLYLFMNYFHIFISQGSVAWWWGLWCCRHRTWGWVHGPPRDPLHKPQWWVGLALSTTVSMQRNAHITNWAIWKNWIWRNDISIYACRKLSSSWPIGSQLYSQS